MRAGNFGHVAAILVVTGCNSCGKIKIIIKIKFTEEILQWSGGFLAGSLPGEFLITTF